jgi:uncharacterized membrane protein (UPF0182 family)
MRRRILIVLSVLLLVLLVTAGLPAGVGLLADWWWFQSVGLTRVFVTGWLARTIIGAAAGVVAFAFFFANFRFALRGIAPDAVQLRIRGAAPRVDLTRFFRWLAWPVAAVLALAAAGSASVRWMDVLQWLKAAPFGETDAVFGRDIGYYVFTVPVLADALDLVIGWLVITLLLVTLVYLLRRDVIVMRRRVTIERAAEGHLAVLLAGLLLFVALHDVLVDLPMLLYSTTGPLTGASYADLAVARPALWISAIVAAAGAAWIVVGARRRRLVSAAVAAAVAYLGVGIGGMLVRTAVQRLVVIPNELAKETPQLERHIQATRKAWGIDRVEVRDLSGESGLTWADIRANAPTIRNVRLWDRDPLLQTFGQLQEIRTYYDFVSVDDDRYWVDGEYRQVLLSPRELNSASLPTRTFINERLTFTHGMGVTLGPVNQVTAEGLPVLFIKDLPPASSVSLAIQRPAIYFGELSNDYVFVNTRQAEFDFPSGEQNTFTRYAGAGGVRVGSAFRRAVLSAYFGSLKMLLSQDITDESRALYVRQIRDRAAKALPFLSWDGDPYLVITADGRLVWLLDAYTHTDRYPYSAALSNGTNYMRNSVKVAIDAYEGDVRAYLADGADPLIRTYERIFPGVFRPLAEMPEDLRAHVRIPEDLFRVQTLLYATYHMQTPEIFYHREDEWRIPDATGAGGARDPFLRHMVMKLPGEGQEEFIIMTPFTPRGKDNLSAWMVARNDGDHYGQLRVYRFPRQSLVFGPTQVVNRVNQDTEISRQVSLWDQRGSQVIRGNLLVIPIEESLIFVQALYLRAEGGRIPELKRVIVAHQNQVVMEETLEEGLRLLFQGGEAEGSVAARIVAAPGVTAPETVADLIGEARSRYEQALEAQRAGDWARYGDEMRRVGDLLRRLAEVTGQGGR